MHFSMGEGVGFFFFFLVCIFMSDMAVNITVPISWLPRSFISSTLELLRS